MIDGENDIALADDDAPLVLTDEIPDDLPAAVATDDAPDDADDDGGEIEISFDGEEPIIAAAKPADKAVEHGADQRPWAIINGDDFKLAAFGRAAASAEQ